MAGFLLCGKLNSCRFILRASKESSKLRWRNVMRKVHLSAALSVLAFCSTLFADQVVLKNGDRLTGTITTSDDKILLIKTEFAGDVTVQWPAVQEINSTQPLHVALSNGKTVVGAITTVDGNLAVNTATSGTVDRKSTRLNSSHL